MNLYSQLAANNFKVVSRESDNDTASVASTSRISEAGSDSDTKLRNGDVVQRKKSRLQNGSTTGSSTL
jgi:hypothetical protein